MEQKTPQAPKKRPRPDAQENSNPTTPLQPQPAQSPFDLTTPAIATPTATPTPSKAQSLFMETAKKQDRQIKVNLASPSSTEKPAPAKKNRFEPKMIPAQFNTFKFPYKSVTQSLLETLRSIHLHHKTKWETLHELTQILWNLTNLFKAEGIKITPQEIRKLKKLYAALDAFIEENKVVGKRGTDEISEEQFRQNSEELYLKLRFSAAQFDFLIKFRSFIHAPPLCLDLYSPMGRNFERVLREKQKANELLLLVNKIPRNFRVYFSASLEERIQHCEKFIESINRIAEKLEIETKNLGSEIIKTQDLLGIANNTKKDLNKKAELAEEEYKKAKRIKTQNHPTKKEGLAPEEEMLRQKYKKCLAKLSAVDEEISRIEEALKKLNVQLTQIITLQKTLKNGEDSLHTASPQTKRVFNHFSNALEKNTDALNKQFYALWNNGNDILFPDDRPTPHTPARESAARVEYNSATKAFLEDIKAFVDKMELMDDQEEATEIDDEEKEAVAILAKLNEEVAPISNEELMGGPVVMNLYEDLRQQREELLNYRNGFDENSVEYLEADEYMAIIEHAIVSALDVQKTGRDLIKRLKKDNKNDKGKEEASPVKIQTPSPFRIHSSEFTFRSPPAPETITPIRKMIGIVQPAPVEQEALPSFSPLRRSIQPESPVRARDFFFGFNSSPSPKKSKRPLESSFFGNLEGPQQEDPRYHIHRVLGDGDCGYTGFGITRDQAYRLLSDNTHSPNVQALLALAMNEANLNNEFQNYVADQDEGIDFDDAIAVAQAFIDFDLIYKQVEGGWPHPAILFALAQIQGVGIRIWRTDITGQLIPNRADDNYDYFEHIPEGATDVIDLLYRGNNHFDRLDIKDEYLQELLFTYARAAEPSPKKHREEEYSVKEKIDDKEILSIPTEKSLSDSPDKPSQAKSMFDRRPIDILNAIEKRFDLIQADIHKKILEVLDDLSNSKPIDEKSLKFFAMLKAADLVSDVKDEMLKINNAPEKINNLKTQVEEFITVLDSIWIKNEPITFERLMEFAGKLNFSAISLGKK